MAKDGPSAPPFRTVLHDIGIDIAMIMDFHGDGHPLDTSPVRLEELKAYFKFCREHSAIGYVTPKAVFRCLSTKRSVWSRSMFRYITNSGCAEFFPFGQTLPSFSR